MVSRPCWQSAGPGNRGLVYRNNKGLTSPCLQSRPCCLAGLPVVSCFGLVAINDFVPEPEDVVDGIAANTRGDVAASVSSNRAGWPDSPDRSLTSGVARGSSALAGIPDGYNTPGSSPGDSEEKKIGNADIVSGPWLPSRGNHKSVCDSLKRKKIEKWRCWEKKKEENRSLAGFYAGAPGLLPNRSIW